MLDHLTLFFSGLFFVVFLVLYFAYYELKKHTREATQASTQKSIELDEFPIIDYQYKVVNDSLLTDFEEIIKSGALIDFNVFQVNDNYFELNDKNLWIVDGGIEFQFYKGYLTIGFSSELEHISVQAVKFDKLYTEDNYEVLEDVQSGKLKAFIGQKVKEVTFKTLEFDEVEDYTMKTKKVSKLVEIILHFENNQILQIALINYDLVENEAPKNFRYNLENDLLISMNTIVAIKGDTK